MDILDIFITSKQADGIRKSTERDYKRVLTLFLNWTSDPTPESWNRDVVRAYVATLRKLTWAPATVAQHVRYLRAFWRWCHNEGYTTEDLSAVIGAPDLSIREEELLTVDEFSRLVNVCSGDRWAIRDRAIILTLVDTGLRRHEFCSLKRDQVRFDDSGGWLMLPSREAKNKRNRYVFLGRAASTALREYLDNRTDTNPALIMSERGPLGGDGVYHMLRRRAKQAGLDYHQVHPHLLRKMFASWWVENGGDEQRLMAIGGWSGPEMLRVYVRLGSRQKLMEAHQQFGPVDRIIGDDHDHSI